MSSLYIASRLDGYEVDRMNAFNEIESKAQESQIVAEALAFLRAHGVIAATEYDRDKMLALREFMHRNLDIPWTSVSLRAQHLIYALNAIARPQTMVAAGIFCGATFLYNAGSATGPGAVYKAKRLIGIEIVPEHAARAQRNVMKVDNSGVANIICADAVQFIRQYEDPIDLLYLDAVAMQGSSTTLDEKNRHSKNLYYDIVRAGYDKIRTGGMVLAHNTFDYAEELTAYTNFVRDPERFSTSVNVILDTQGLEVSRK